MIAVNRRNILLLTLITAAGLMLGSCYYGSGTVVSTPPLNTDSTQSLVPTETAEPDDPAPVADLSRSGNLHYHNFVLCLEDSLVFSSIEDQLSRYYLKTEQTIELSAETASQLISDGRSIFFNQSRISGPLMKIDLDGTNQVRISQLQLKYLFDYQERLYGIDLATHQPVSLKKDGTDRQVLSEAMATSLILDQDKLYVTFANAVDGVWQFDLETGSQNRIISRAVTSLNITDEWLYFSDALLKYNVFAWSLSENRGWPISSFSLDKPFIINDGWLYGVLAEEQNRLLRWPLDGRRSLSREKPQLVIDDAVAAFVICGGYIYYQRPDSQRIYQASLDGGPPRRIT